MPRKSWWARLPFAARMMAGTSALLIVIGGGAAGIAALTKDHDAPRIVTAVGQAAAEAARPAPEQALGRPTAPQKPVAPHAAGRQATADDQADRTGTRAPRAAATAPAPGRPALRAPAAANPAGPDSPTGPVTTTRTDVETHEIPFQTRLVRDPSLPRGTKRIQTPGVPGQETVRYLVTLVDGKQTDRQLIDSTVTKEPQQRVVAFGTAGRPGGRGHGPRDGECGRGLRFCVPLGRKSSCTERTAEQREESALQLGGSVVVLDQDIELLDAETLAGMPGVTC
jgi:hypothetical protein